MPYAFVEDNKVIDVKDNLPQNWRNISNFYIHANDYDYLKSLGWYPVTFPNIEYNPQTQRLDNWRYNFNGNSVDRLADVIDVPQPSAADIQRAEQERVNTRWQEIRIQRDEMMRSFEWRYTRYERQKRLGIPTTDQIENLDTYMQALADITLQADPYNIIWPSYS
jgi:hypothetical protein